MNTPPAPPISVAQLATNAGRLCWLDPLMSYLSGVVFLQYANFCRQQQPTKSLRIFWVATILVSTHALQICVELWTGWAALMSYLSGRNYPFLIDESLETGLTAIIVLLVQYHFCRIAHTIIDTSLWIIFTRAVTIVSFVAALGAASRFAQISQDGQLHESAPLALDATLLGFYIAWLALNFVADITISVKLGKALYCGLRFARQKSTRGLLGRLLTVTINTFSLTCLATCCSLVMVTLPYIVPMSLQTVDACQVTGYTINRSLPRIYISSFFFSFKSGRDPRPEQSDMHVASLEMSRSSSSLGRASMRAANNFRPEDFTLVRFQAQNPRISITREVHVVIENGIQGLDTGEWKEYYSSRN